MNFGVAIVETLGMIFDSFRPGNHHLRESKGGRILHGESLIYADKLRVKTCSLYFKVRITPSARDTAERSVRLLLTKKSRLFLQLSFARDAVSR